MITIETDPRPDPYQWLLDRLNEVYQIDPEATLADGLEYASAYIEEE